MTNEVERLILESNSKEVSINYSELIAYKLYTIIWKYILSNKRYDYNYIKISFNVKEMEGQYYILQNEGINYEVVGDGFKFHNLSYFEGIDNTIVKDVLNTNIDFQLLLDLIVRDEFGYILTKLEDGFHIDICVDRKIVNYIVNNVLAKNKLLKR